VAVPAWVWVVRMRNVALAVALLCLTAGCAQSQSASDVGSRCDLADGGVAACPEGTYCAVVPGGMGARTCRVLCDGGAIGASRCASGETCMRTFEAAPALNPPTCWPGGELVEGAECVQPYTCGRGLWCAEDHSRASEGVGTCQPVCNRDADCTASGEHCIDGIYCASPCDPATPSTCPENTLCRVDSCVWAARAADCEHDGVPDCPIGQICAGELVGVYTCKTPVEYVF
jgi:hypothetical protein